MSNQQHSGNFFEDFHLGQIIRHGTPRTLTDGDAAVYMALTGARHLKHSSSIVAKDLGLAERPLDDLLVFNVAFGKTVPDISLNAVANLGYAELCYLAPVFAGDTLRCESTVIGLNENSSRKTGVVYVRSVCRNGDNDVVLSWVRWVMVHKRDPSAQIRERFVPPLAPVVAPNLLVAQERFGTPETVLRWCEATCSNNLWDDYGPGDRIDHPCGVTIENADHMSATRLYQNNARAHFDARLMQASPIGARLVYGGHVISVCRALAYDGMENILGIAAINAGSHVAPTVAGDTLYACSEVLEKWELPGRADIGALRIRLIGLRNSVPQMVHLEKTAKKQFKAVDPAVVLDLDYTVLMPRRPAALSADRINHEVQLR